MLTAENITDEQISELGREAWATYAETLNALTTTNGVERRIAARARCAAILNARSAVSK